MSSVGGRVGEDRESGGRAGVGGAQSGGAGTEDGQSGGEAGAMAGGGESGGKGNDSVSSVDECALGQDNCAAHAQCVDTAESFECVCDAGYSGNGVTCDDIDECKVGWDSCDSNATCLNKSGSYQCACNVPYVGDGENCTCVLPSLTNLIHGGGFDVAASITATNTVGVLRGVGVTWSSSEDRDACADSGAAHFGTENALISLCGPVTGGQTYFFGFDYKYKRGNALMSCAITYYYGLCDGNLVGETQRSPITLSDNGESWKSAAPFETTAPADARSFDLVCTSSPSVGESVDFYVDHIYFNSASAEFYSASQK